VDGGKRTLSPSFRAIVNVFQYKEKLLTDAETA
jgi:hypothetical protein